RTHAPSRPRRCSDEMRSTIRRRWRSAGPEWRRQLRGLPASPDRLTPSGGFGEHLEERGIRHVLRVPLDTDQPLPIGLAEFDPFDHAIARAGDDRQGRSNVPQSLVMTAVRADVLRLDGPEEQGERIYRDVMFSGLVTDRAGALGRQVLIQRPS